MPRRHREGRIGAGWHRYPRQQRRPSGQLQIIDDISDEEWELTFKVNIHAMFYLTKAAVSHMKPGSCIINTASINSDVPNPTLLAYATTKGAIQNFTAGLAQMLAEKGIRANAVAPGPIWTPLIPSTLPEDSREKFRQTGADEAPRSARRVGHRLCHASRSAFELCIWRDDCCDWRQALPIEVSSPFPGTPPAADRLPSPEQQTSGVMKHKTIEEISKRMAGIRYCDPLNPYPKRPDRKPPYEQ